MTKRRFFPLGTWIVAILLSAVLALHFRSTVKGNILALYDLSLYNQTTSSLVSPVEARLVAHAGGAVRGLTYTNSREALDENYAKGYRVFELDFHWTTDDRLVLVHDWDHTSSLFSTQPHVFSYKEFSACARRDGLHQLTFEELHEWLRNHPDALVVTDTKANNERLVSYLQKNARDILPQLIVQIYRLSELRQARQLGCRAVWLSVYKSSYPAWALSKVSGVDAFVIPIKDYAKYYNPYLMAKVHFYVHSIPANLVGESYQHLPGTYGFYVD